MTPTTTTSMPLAPAPCQAPAPAAVAPLAAPTDFLQMLGQLISEGAAPPAVVAAAGEMAVNPKVEPWVTDSVTSTEEESEFVAALLGLAPTPPPTPIAPFASQLPPQVTADAPLEPADIMSEIELAKEPPRMRMPAFGLMPDVVVEASKAPQIDAAAQPSFESLMPAQPTLDMSAPQRHATATEHVLSRPVHQPVGTHAWTEEIGSRVTIMAETGKHTASLRLSPEHLGPLEIRIAIQDDQASVWFGAAHADTRAAIEHALPRLRELFEAQGMSLTDAGVSHEPPKQHEATDARSSTSMTEGSSEEPKSSLAVAVKLGLIDAYA